MTSQTVGGGPRSLRLLSAAHEAVAIVAGMALTLVVAIAWENPVRTDIGPVRRVALAALGSSVVYLYSTGWLQLRASDAVRALWMSRTKAWLHLALVHAAVLAASLRIVVRGASSRAYLGGLHQVTAAIATVATLALVVTLVSWHRARAPRTPGEADQPARPAVLDATVLIPWILHTVASLLTAGALLYLESMPLPHLRPVPIGMAQYQ